MTAGARAPKRPGVKSALRVLDLLEALAAAPAALGVSEISRRLAIPKSSASMLLLTLEARGYVVDQGDRRFILHAALGRGSRSWVGGFRARLVRLAQPALQRLSRATGETALLGVPSGAHRIEYAAKVVSAEDVRVDVDLGLPRAIHSTSAGLAMLAHRPAEAVERYLEGATLERMTRYTICDPKRLRRELAAIRQSGYALLHESHTLHDSGVAAPVFAADGEVAGALNVSAPTARMRRTHRRVAAHVVREARRLTRELAGEEPEAG
jgi:DNA-binding IclR family transcriptional regulator